jgi:hypothetical protein
MQQGSRGDFLLKTLIKGSNATIAQVDDKRLLAK